MGAPRTEFENNVGDVAVATSLVLRVGVDLVLVSDRVRLLGLSVLGTVEDGDVDLGR